MTQDIQNRRIATQLRRAHSEPPNEISGHVRLIAEAAFNSNFGKRRAGREHSNSTARPRQKSPEVRRRQVPDHELPLQCPDGNPKIMSDGLNGGAGCS